MTERVKEQLSAFLDGELPEAEAALLLKRLDRDQELRAALSRYSLIGSVLRSDGDMPAAHGVAARVRAAVAREPRPGAWPTRVYRPVAGLGIAATVAAVSVLLLQPRTEPPLQASAAPELAAESGVLVAAADPPAALVTEPEPEQAPSYTTPPAVDGPGTLPAAQFANYLVAHSGYTSPLARSSVVAGLIAADDPVTDASGVPRHVVGERR
ncbi:MAG: hypothetical protein FJ191_11790 [Gammaproteobacteria bacterium]|nr:hypothetical protein [Gammaproteobacteria bacterium]